MRWFITIKGETHGPVDESVARSWIRQKQVPPGSMVAPEGPQCTWVPVEKSPLAPQPRAWVAVVVLVLSCCVLFAICSPSKPAPTVRKGAPASIVPGSKPATSEHVERKCVLSIPGSSDGVLVFPTEDGLDEFGKAAASGDEQAMQVARRANGGFFVEARTKCTWLDVGFARTKVRVTEGDRAGAAGFVPTEWASGR